MSELPRQPSSEAANEPRYILLTEWAKGRIQPEPSLWTLRAMARTGKIEPRPVKIGKAYYVEPDARVVDPNRRPTLVDRLKSA
jgi:hypothetical protein